MSEGNTTIQSEEVSKGFFWKPDGGADWGKVTAAAVLAIAAVGTLLGALALGGNCVIGKYWAIGIIVGGVIVAGIAGKILHQLHTVGIRKNSSGDESVSAIKEPVVTDDPLLSPHRQSSGDEALRMATNQKGSIDEKDGSQIGDDSPRGLTHIGRRKSSMVDEERGDSLHATSLIIDTLDTSHQITSPLVEADVWTQSIEEKISNINDVSQVKGRIIGTLIGYIERLTNSRGRPDKFLCSCDNAYLIIHGQYSRYGAPCSQSYEEAFGQNVERGSEITALLNEIMEHWISKEWISGMFYQGDKAMTCRQGDNYEELNSRIKPLLKRNDPISLPL